MGTRSAEAYLRRYGWSVVDTWVLTMELLLRRTLFLESENEELVPFSDGLKLCLVV